MTASEQTIKKLWQCVRKYFGKKSKHFSWGWTKDCLRSFRSYRILTPCRRFADFVERTALQSTWEGAAELGIPPTVAPPNEILSWLTYSHRFTSMDHVTWIRQVVHEGALYCYSSYLLVFDIYMSWGYFIVWPCAPSRQIVTSVLVPLFLATLTLEHVT
jgi:hypothetical protein